MDQLTLFEKHLLRECETLATSCENLSKQYQITTGNLSRVSEKFGVKIREIERRQHDLSDQLDQLVAQLNKQNQRTNDLVDAVNRLIEARNL